jgi:hypothetical protein
MATRRLKRGDHVCWNSEADRVSGHLACSRCGSQEYEQTLDA